MEHNNPECKLFISDPAKGYNDSMADIDIAFLQIRVPTEDDGTQDLSLMKQLISALPDVPVFVRTTILPGTSDLLSKETGHRVHYMPEFLTERTHIEDFKKQTMVFTGAQDLLTRIFVGKKFTINQLVVLSNMESANSEMLKQGIDRQERYRILQKMATEQLALFDRSNAEHKFRKLLPGGDTPMLPE